MFKLERFHCTCKMQPGLGTRPIFRVRVRVRVSPNFRVRVRVRVLPVHFSRVWVRVRVLVIIPGCGWHPRIPFDGYGCRVRVSGTGATRNYSCCTDQAIYTPRSSARAIASTNYYARSFPPSFCAAARSWCLAANLHRPLFARFAVVPNLAEQ